MFRKILLPVLLSASLIMTACGADNSDQVYDNSRYDSAAAAEAAQKRQKAASSRAHAESSMKLWLDEGGKLNIERPTLIENTHITDDNTWTIFVYICGSNLEDEIAMATSDMTSMLYSGNDERVKFIVETGGANNWQNDWCKPDELDRLAIYNGQVELVDKQPIANMGDSQTLADFLRWGIEAYPAENYGLVLWDHGGGSLSGVCFDEKYDGQSLTLRDIDNALLSVNDMLARNFEFVGFDACLMGTLETANMLASHAYYMYGSQEIEWGWDYEAIGRYLMQNPDADGADLGKAVTDSYYAVMADYDKDASDNVAISVIDLSKMDDLIISFNTFAKNLYDATEDTAILAEAERSVLTADNFGGNNDSVGYSNLVDLGGIVDNCSTFADGGAEVKAALNEAVSYVKNGANHAESGGLSVYYPLSVTDSPALRTFSDVAVSPYYFAYAARIAYGAITAGAISDFDDSEIMESWGHAYAYDDGSDWNYNINGEPSTDSSFITYAVEPGMNDSGRYGFTLTQEAIDYTKSVKAVVFMFADDAEDANDAVTLGLTADIGWDWEKGEFCDGFDGYWFSLPNGQNLAIYNMTEGDGYDVYSSPVEVNGDRTNLIFTHDYVNNSITINGIWDGIDENGMADRADSGLKDGDMIRPVYVSYNEETGEDGEYSAVDEYEYRSGDELEFDLLPNGVYQYGFVIYDIFGGLKITDTIDIRVDDDSFYYVQQ